LIELETIVIIFEISIDSDLFVPGFSQASIY